MNSIVKINRKTKILRNEKTNIKIIKKNAMKTVPQKIYL